MTTTIRGEGDETLAMVRDALGDFEAQHPQATIDLYRQNSISIRIRIIDPCFAGMKRSERHALAWASLGRLPEEVQGDISMVVLLTPEEVQGSLANLEFEEPTPSLIR